MNDIVESLDSWGCITNININEKIERTAKYKQSLLCMANNVQEILIDYQKENHSFKHFLMDGSLLGAHRNGKMIEHDYDFDFGIYFGDNVDKLMELYEFIKKRLYDYNHYECKLINTYSHKIEIYDPSLGVHSEVAEDFYNCIMDLQLYKIDENNKDILRIQYFKDDYHKRCNFQKEWFFPLSTILFENYTYPCANNPEKVLTEIYGYIGPNAIFDKTICKYVPK